MRIKIKEAQKMGDGRSEMGYRSEMRIKIKENCKAESGMLSSSGRNPPAPADNHPTVERDARMGGGGSKGAKGRPTPACAVVA